MKLLLIALLVTTSLPALRIKSFYASSELKASKSYSYGPAHVADDKAKSAWVEGVKGDGINEYIVVNLSKPTTLIKLSIINGFAHKKYWAMNNRVRQLHIGPMSGHGGETITLEDSMKPQEVTLAKPLKIMQIKFTIKSIYPGSKWQDTALSEITFLEPKARVRVVDVTRDYALGLWYAQGIGSVYMIHVQKGGHCMLYAHYHPKGDNDEEPCSWRLKNGYLDIEGSRFLYFSNSIIRMSGKKPNFIPYDQDGWPEIYKSSGAVSNAEIRREIKEMLGGAGDH